ncbi:hypothetical protein NXS19_002089 [Fusarium pseudograminearum]|nr:hypothetical protein NXS19_002089 [Fusarium pseudograminearum]
MAQFTTTCDIAPHLITGLCKGEEDLSVLGPVTIASLCKEIKNGLNDKEDVQPLYWKPHVIEFLQVETLFNHFARGLFDVGDNIGRPLLGACCSGPTTLQR